MISEATLDKLQNGGRIAEEEWHEILDWLCLHQFCQAGNVNFWYVNHYFCEDSLKILSENPGRWMTLAEIYDCFAPASRIPFLLHCFRLRSYLSVSELAVIWYKSFEYDELLEDFIFGRGSGKSQKIQVDRATCLDYPPKVPADVLRQSMLTDPLLIDNPIVIRRFCQCKKDGWECLQHINGRKWGRLKLEDSLAKALENYNTAEFCIRWDMMNASRKITIPLLMEIIGNEADGIFREMLPRVPQNELRKSLPGLCLHTVIHSPDPTATKLLQAIEAVHPCFLSKMHDHWGRNLLWYAMQNSNFASFQPRCTFTPFLLEAGCDPNNRNQLGLSWQDANDWLTLSKKNR